MNTDGGVDHDTEVTRNVIGAAIHVSNVLGAGFLEKVYENALMIELRHRGREVDQQQAVSVRYREEIVGVFQADLIVDRRVVVELKAVRRLDPVHRAQCLNYLRATGIRTGLVLNFGTPRLEVQRVLCGYLSATGTRCLNPLEMQ
jgi:GxxExxY protein